MTDTQQPAHALAATQRWAIYAILIAASLGQAAGKILSVNDVSLSRLESSRIDARVDRERERLTAQGTSGAALEEAVSRYEERLEEELRLQRPFLSANDRSRWLAIRAIAETGSHEIDDLIQEPTWDTIDMVQHRGRDGELHLYSSKPPLLMVLIAGPYWALMQLTGTTLGESPYELGRFLLLLLNGGSLVVMLAAVARIVERVGVGDVDRLFAMVAASFGTQLLAFTPVLNNHLFAAAGAAVTCSLWLRLLDDDNAAPLRSFWTGIAAAMTVACELPALAFAAFVALTLVLKRPSETMVRFGAGALLVAVAFFGTNYWAHQSLSPAYAHRSDTDAAANWYDYEYTVRGKVRESYWRDRQGIDQGEPSRAVYALHSLVGHHGVFSLTPLWLLSVGGTFALLRSRDRSVRLLAWATLLVSGACLVFYLGLRPIQDRNYGGMTSGFRWMFWLAPLWLAMAPAAVERLRGSRVGLAVAATLLTLSAMSASYATWNPWTHPWVYRWMQHVGFDLP